MRIYRQGQQEFFQVRLPIDTEKIIGIETGLQMETAIPVYVRANDAKQFSITRNRLIGTVQLQSIGKGNLFFAKEIIEHDLNVSNAEIIKEIHKVQIHPSKSVSKVSGKSKGVIVRVRTKTHTGFEAPLFQNNLQAYATRMEEDPIDIDGDKFLQGMYKDVVGKNLHRDLIYHVNLYIWIETKKTAVA